MLERRNRLLTTAQLLVNAFATFLRRADAAEIISIDNLHVIA